VGVFVLVHALVDGGAHRGGHLFIGGPDVAQALRPNGTPPWLNLGDEASSLNPWTGRRAARDTRCMVKSVEGIYRNGKVELLESLAEAEGSRVVVTWVHPAEPVDLRERGIDESQAADLRHRLAPFAEDWDRPEMAAYDELPTR
jgi:hypothetical protein